jgi:hypothetical protein
LPTPHWRHTEEAVARTTALYSPAAQDEQSVSAVPLVVALYLPATHAGQVFAAVFLYLPVGQ